MEMGSMGEAKTWLLVAAIRGWRLIDLGFSRRGQYIGERAMSVGARGAHTMWPRGQGGAAPPPGVAASLAPFESPSDSVYVTEK